MNSNAESISMDAGQVERFVQLLTANQHRIYAYILTLLSNSSDADDVMQETTTVMWRKFCDYQSGTDFVAWGVAIAHYCIMSYRRKQGSMVAFDEEVIELLEAQSRPVMQRMDYRMDALKDCLGKLSEDDRRLIYLRYHQELEVRTVAARLDKNVRWIYRAVSRIHTALLHCMEHKLALEGLK